MIQIEIVPKKGVNAYTLLRSRVHDAQSFSWVFTAGGANRTDPSPTDNNCSFSRQRFRWIRDGYVYEGRAWC